MGKAQAEFRQFDDARCSIDEAIAAVETTNERWWEADIYRMAGEIALMSPTPDAPKAETYFDRALAVARQRQAKSWELRAAMSMARLWRDQGKRSEARDLLAPVYGWFTEGFEGVSILCSGGRGGRGRWCYRHDFRSAITAKVKLAGLWRENVDQYSTGTVSTVRVGWENEGGDRSNADE
jgi:hypothetical protein